MSKTFFLVAISLNLLAYPLQDQFIIKVFLCILSYGFLFFNEYKTLKITCVGGFIFGSFIFFCIRPLYILIENDFLLIERAFFIFDSKELVSNALWWSNFGLIFFKLGSLIKFKNLGKKSASFFNLKVSNDFNSTKATKYLIILITTITLPIISYFTQFSRLVYQSSLGAYFYQFPSLLQSLNVFCCLIFIREYGLKRTFNNLAFASISFFYVLYFAFQMREISQFRSFYLTGVTVLIVASIHFFSNQKVNYLWLVIPFIIAQPFFRILGAVRWKLNEDLNFQTFFFNNNITSNFLSSYWDFYSSKGDINIFDTFVAAFNAKPQWYPYFESWLYVPLHFIPRFIWEGKPDGGLLQDLSFANGLPLSPGLIGFFLLDGGLIWMLGSMTLLGIILSFIDDYINSLNDNLLKSYIYGTFVVACVTLSRMALYQTFYEIIYGFIPVILISLIVFPYKRKKVLP